MASDDELRPTQTQSQPSEVDMNGSIPENDKLAWGRLIARRYGIEDYGKIEMFATEPEAELARLTASSYLLFTFHA